MPDIVFNEQTHEYIVDDKKYPSVTQILDLLTYTEFANIDKGVLETASRRGTAIHEATENLDYGGYAEVDAETEPYVQATWTSLVIIYPIGTEWKSKSSTRSMASAER